MFRAGAGEPWQRAETVAISGDSLSFTAKTKLPVGTSVDMRFVVGTKSVGSEVACRGRIVQLEQPDPEKKSKTLTYGATIESYKFKRN
jgi:hypothetical protein